MSAARRHLDYLRDIADMMGTVVELTDAMTFEQFATDKRTALAVRKAIEIIGEAAKHLPPSFRDRHDAIPWKQMAGMRDRLIHAYWGINIDILWATATEVIPSLRPRIALVLEQELAREQRARPAPDDT
ncbi:MAG: DUF86 domain-containing protein [Chloroflexi bacterium]|nr:DUF86 domain-containing protein [Chloroflexota bacterium]